MIHYRRRGDNEPLLRFQRKERVRQPNGTFKTDWVTTHRIRAFIRPLSGNESQRGQRNVETSTHRIYLPIVIPITSIDRVVDEQNIVYDITYLHNPMNADRQLLVEVTQSGTVDNAKDK